MDDHWRSIAEIKTDIAEVKATATTQTDRFTAQLNGLRATTDMTTTALRTDINDLRGRIIPSLREQATSITSSVQRLEDRLNFDARRNPCHYPTPPRRPTDLTQRHAPDDTHSNPSFFMVHPSNLSTKR